MHKYNNSQYDQLYTAAPQEKEIKGNWYKVTFFHIKSFNKERPRDGAHIPYNIVHVNFRG